MKTLRLLLLSMMLLVFPAVGTTAYAGHAVPGGAYCDGVCSGGVCSKCGAECGIRGLTASTEEPTAFSSPDADTADLGIVLVALLLWLRLKA